MLTAYPPSCAREGNLADAMWVDLIEPTDAEAARVEAALGLRVPTRAELSEIEASSRLRCIKDTLYMSVPLIATEPPGQFVHTPAGFVLGKRACLTIRYAPSAAFDAVSRELESEAAAEPGQ